MVISLHIEISSQSVLVFSSPSHFTDFDKIWTGVRTKSCQANSILTSFIPIWQMLHIRLKSNCFT